jgi:hypothetical protein
VRERRDDEFGCKKINGMMGWFWERKRILDWLWVLTGVWVGQLFAWLLKEGSCGDKGWLVPVELSWR